MILFTFSVAQLLSQGQSGLLNQGLLPGHADIHDWPYEETNQ